MNSPYTFLFPGQGAQALGMAVDLADSRQEARRIFDMGRDVLGRDVLAICRSGPEEELNSTRISQPAIFLHSMAALEVLGTETGSGGFCQGLDAPGAAGLSLGEYSALVFVGSLTFQDALQIVSLRGQYMQEACDTTKGTMASVIAMATAKVEEIIESAKTEGFLVSVANYNSPDQTVISGEASAVEEAVKRLTAAGARKTIRLKVAGAYHSPLMAPATKKLEPYLRAVKIREPRVPFFSNVTGAQVRDPEAIRRNLILQVEHPVRWEQILRALAASGMKRALEVGPGKVLAGLLRSVVREVEVTNAGTLGAVLKLKEELLKPMEVSDHANG